MYGSAPTRAMPIPRAPRMSLATACRFAPRPWRQPAACSMQHAACSMLQCWLHWAEVALLGSESVEACGPGRRRPENVHVCSANSTACALCPPHCLRLPASLQMPMAPLICTHTAQPGALLPSSCQLEDRQSSASALSHSGQSNSAAAAGPCNCQPQLCWRLMGQHAPCAPMANGLFKGGAREGAGDGASFRAS